MPRIYRGIRYRAAAAIQRAFRRRRAMRGIVNYARKRRAIMRGAVAYNPMPTFTETYATGTINSNAGGVFNVRISDIPQVAQYTTLYKQYRINWVKVMLLPVFNYDSADVNSAAYNNSIPGIPATSNARITFAINDSPAMIAPANETDVLTDNGAKVKPIRSKWSCSFKPVPDVASIVNATGNPVATRQKFRQWFNFAEQTGNNPQHFGVSYWITQNVTAGFSGVFNVYYKINFSLRDPQ